VPLGVLAFVDRKVAYSLLRRSVLFRGGREPGMHADRTGRRDEPPSRPVPCTEHGGGLALMVLVAV